MLNIFFLKQEVLEKRCYGKIKNKFFKKDWEVERIEERIKKRSIEEGEEGGKKKIRGGERVVTELITDVLSDPASPSLIILRTLPRRADRQLRDGPNTIRKIRQT
jgi:hypothetical protein